MKIEFTKDFAVSKKGDVLELKDNLAAKLIKRKVAKEFTEKSKKKAK
jgi:hypothetical protein